MQTLTALPPSKSVINRALLLAAMAHGQSQIKGASLFVPGLGDDITIMLRALAGFGVGISLGDGEVRVQPPSGGFDAPPPLDVGSAGTALRFLLPLAALHSRSPVRFIGSKRLFERPLAPLLEALGSIGARWHSDRDGGLLVPAESVPGFLDIEIDGSLSSQFVSGLAMAVAGTKGGGVLRLATRTASSGYLSLTKRWMKRFGCQVRLFPDRVEIPGGSLRAVSTEAMGDWSAAAALFCGAAIMGREIDLSPLDTTDGQPDAAILAILKSIGCSCKFDGHHCRLYGRINGGLDADLEPCPDLAPVLTAVAAFAPAPSELCGLGTLEHKESDRLGGCIKLAAWLGASAKLAPGHALRITPRPDSAEPFATEPFDPMGDHRMAFAAAIGGLRSGGMVLDAGCVSKSFPGFWEAINQHFCSANGGSL